MARYSTATREKVVRAYAAGDVSYAALSRLYGMCADTIRCWCYAAGVAAPQRSPYTSARRAEAVRLYRSGYTLHETAELVEMGPGAVTQALHAAGAMRSVQDAKRLGACYTDTVRQRCINLYEKDRLSNADIAERTGIPEPTIRHWTRTAGVSRSQEEATRTASWRKKMCPYEEHRPRGLRMYKAGMAPKAVAKKIGCSQEVILRWAREAGIRRTRTSPYDIYRGAVVRWYRGGFTIAAIARMVGTSHTVVVRLLGDAYRPDPLSFDESPRLAHAREAHAYWLGRDAGHAAFWKEEVQRLSAAHA